jgi:hypothetical protein
MTNAKKHIIAPRAQNQEDMMLWFQGTFYNLGERYTVSLFDKNAIFSKYGHNSHDSLHSQDLTKIVFVVFYYSSLFPFVFVFGFVILAVQYMVDRFSLFRLWGWNPLLGAELATFSRKYMYLACLAVFAIVSSYTYAQLPYDNICDPENPQSGVSGVYTGVTNAGGDLIYEGMDNEGVVQVQQDTTVVFCKYSKIVHSNFDRFSALLPPSPSL